MLPSCILEFSSCIRVEGANVPTTFPIGDDGFGVVSTFSLSLTSQFHAQTVHIDEHVFDAKLGQLTHTDRQISTVYEDGKVWLLTPGGYIVYGLTDSLIGASTKVVTPKESSTCTMQTTDYSPRLCQSRA